MKIGTLKWLQAASVILSVLGFSNADANVSLKNGNFFIGYTDIVYPGGFEPKIERVYNSKTNFKGIFGWGWGNEYEVYLTVSVDGSVVVHEYGGGAENRFSPVTFKREELVKAVEKIVSVAKSTGGLPQAQVEKYRSRLMTEASFRNDEWEKYRAQGKMERRVLPVSTQLISNRFSYQYITKVQGGYQRAFDNGKLERFDESGRLSKLQDKNGNWIELKYARDGHLERLEDNFNRKMSFSFNSQGQVGKVIGESGKTAEYEYNNLGELVRSKDSEGNVYTFKYDSEKHHNMVEIGYKDKTTMAMTYYPSSLFENIKTVKDRDGTITEYGYDLKPGDRKNYSVTVKVKGTDGKQISSSKYEYFLKHKSDGEEWTFRLITTIDGDRTETTYNECCGLPVAIKHGNQETSFSYDAKGHVTKKTTPNEVTELEYDNKVGKVTKVKKFSKTDKRRNSWSEFKYDDKGNLTFAKNSEGRGVKLIYDTNGRIKSLVDQNRRQINFKYNENSKPVEITDPSLGTITVSYTNSGEIKKVESSAGRKIALQVTSAFQNLLDIIRPAGVSLSF